MKPRVFISSTIYDFKDLRSALKYWIEEMGYEAVLSEHNDFTVYQDISSYESCLKEIETCDYFILLIGARAGGFYDKENKITITMQEYNTAYELSLQGKIKIIPFVRRAIWDVREDRSALSKLIKQEGLLSGKNSPDTITYHDSKIIQDAELIFNFLNQVCKVSEMRSAISKGTSFPKNNWINQFERFEDIITTLKVQLSLDAKLSEKILLFNLKSELENTMKSLLKKSGQDLTLITELLWSQRIQVINLDSKDQYITNDQYITEEEFNQLLLFYLHTKDFKCDSIFLMEAISRGLFLHYDTTNNTYIHTHVSKAAEKLLCEINMISDENYKDRNEKIFHQLRTCKAEQIQRLVILCAEIHCDELHNIFVLSRYLRNRIIDLDFSKSLDSCDSNGKYAYRERDIYATHLSDDEVESVCKET